MKKSNRTQRSRAHRILIIDDEESFHKSIVRYLDSYRLFHSYTATSGLHKLGNHAIDVVILDLGLPDYPGIDLLKKISEAWPSVPVIVVTASSEITIAVAAVKAGAFDFLTKRHEHYQALGYHIQRALEHRSWYRQKVATSTSANQSYHEVFTLMENTDSISLRTTLALIKKTAPTPLPILIEGPSGAGKEVMARYIHASSLRNQSSFVAVNVGAVPETLLESQLFGHEKGAFTGAVAERVGKFELASGGTLFLDEIADLAPASQVKLLRVLQEQEVERVGGREARPIDCRVLAATNKNLRGEVAAGRFREDLYYRLNGLTIQLPSLAERKADIPPLVNFLATKSANTLRTATPRFGSSVMNILSSYTWPGNIRELGNLVMRLVATCSDGVVAPDDIPPEYWLSYLNEEAHKSATRHSEGRLYFLARDQFERYLVRHMVHRAGGNKRKAARDLGVSYSTVKEKNRERPFDFNALSSCKIEK